MLRLGCVETGLHNCVSCCQILVQSIEKRETKSVRNIVHCLAPNMYGMVLALFLSDDD
jgi:hypothetical protein